MKKNRRTKLLICLVWAALIGLGCSTSDDFNAELAMESDAMAIVNYYQPKRILLQNQPPEPNLILPQFVSSNPMFGALLIGNTADSVITLALDESLKDGLSYLYIDRNNNETLTDDGDPEWDEEKNQYWIKEALVDVQYEDSNHNAAVPYPISFYRYKTRFSDSIVAFRNGYREGYIALKDTSYKIALFDDDLNGLFNLNEKGAIIIDTNRDGRLDGKPDSPEYFSLRSAFNVQGTTYRVKEISPAGDRIKLTVADTMVFPKESLDVGQRAPLIRTRTIDGNIVDLADYRNKVVLLDFWATYCKPWEDDLPNLKSVYRRYHERGFEIIGVNLDYDLEALRKFIKANEIPWPQISNGKGWEMTIVDIYRVEAIPKSFLLDRTGTIRYKNLQGRNLSAKVYELLNEPEIVN